MRLRFPTLLILLLLFPSTILADELIDFESSVFGDPIETLGFNTSGSFAGAPIGNFGVNGSQGVEVFVGGSSTFASAFLVRQGREPAVGSSFSLSAEFQFEHGADPSSAAGALQQGLFLLTPSGAGIRLSIFQTNTEDLLVLESSAGNIFSNPGNIMDYGGGAGTSFGTSDFFRMRLELVRNDVADFDLLGQISTLDGQVFREVSLSGQDVQSLFFGDLVLGITASDFAPGNLSGQERVRMDNMRFTAIPEPAANLIFTSLAVLCVIRRSHHR